MTKCKKHELWHESVKTMCHLRHLQIILILISKEYFQRLLKTFSVKYSAETWLIWIKFDLKQTRVSLWIFSNGKYNILVHQFETSYIFEYRSKNWQGMFRTSKNIKMKPNETKSQKDYFKERQDNWKIFALRLKHLDEYFVQTFKLPSTEIFYYVYPVLKRNEIVIFRYIFIHMR